jgi:hypothetical protein
LCVHSLNKTGCFDLRITLLSSDWQSQGVQFTSLTLKFSGRQTTSLERRLRRNSGSRRVAHCFYPEYVRKLVGVSSTDLRRNGPVLRAHSGVTVSICTYSRVDQSDPIFCVLPIGYLTGSNSKYVTIVLFLFFESKKNLACKNSFCVPIKNKFAHFNFVSPRT